MFCSLWRWRMCSWISSLDWLKYESVLFVAYSIQTNVCQVLTTFCIYHSRFPIAWHVDEFWATDSYLGLFLSLLLSVEDLETDTAHLRNKSYEDITMSSRRSVFWGQKQSNKYCNCFKGNSVESWLSKWHGEIFMGLPVHLDSLLIWTELFFPPWSSLQWCQMINVYTPSELVQ